MDPLTTSVRSVNGKQKDTDDGDVNKKVTWGEFADNSTLHGIKYLNATESPWVARFAWLLAILLCIAIGVVSVEKFFTSYFKNETSTKLKNVELDWMVLPKVIVCDHNAFKKSTVDDAIATHELIGLDLLLDNMYGWGPAAVQVNWSEPQYEKLMNLTSEEMYDLLFEISPKPSELFQHVMMVDQALDPDVVFKQVMTDLGICFELNANGTLNATMAGMAGGLHLMINVNPQDYYLGFYAALTGVSLIFYEHNDAPNVITDAFTGIRPGSHVDLSLSKNVIRRQPPPADSNTANCFDTKTEPNPLKTFENYSHNGCIREAQALYNIEKCGCRNIFDPAIPGFQLCKPDVLMQCIKEPQDYSLVMQLANCRRPCEVAQYRAQMALYDYPNAAVFQRKYFIPAEYIGLVASTTCSVVICYQSLSYDLLEEFIPYTWKDVFASLGGTLGLCVGASLLSFAELFQFILNYCVGAVRRRKYSNKSSGTGSIIKVSPAP